MSDQSYNLAPLIDVIARYLEGAIGKHDGPNDITERAMVALADVPGEAVVGEKPQLPACKMIPMLRAASQPERELLEALRPVVDALPWVQNANYRNVPEMQSYLANSAYCEIIGAQTGLFFNPNTIVGFFLMGRDIHYGAHSHPAAELYSVLSGTAKWWRDGEDWIERPPGSRIYHAPHRSHAMASSSQPLLALFVWSGDVGVSAVAD